MEEAARKTEGVKNAAVNFMALKMTVDFENGADPVKVYDEGQKNADVWMMTARFIYK